MGNNMDLNYEMFAINVNRQPTKKAAPRWGFVVKPQKSPIYRIY